jgi:DNA-binding MarR family transcriptional regulator
MPITLMPVIPMSFHAVQEVVASTISQKLVDTTIRYDRDMTRTDPRPALRMDELESRAWLHLVALTELLPAALDAQLQRDAGMTHFEFLVLSVLRLRKEPVMRTKELAAATHSTLPRLSHVLTRLEARGLVERSPCSEDRRATNVELTPEGRRELIHALPGHLATVRALVLEPLDRDQLAALADATEAIGARLDPGDRFFHAVRAE